jgi:benzoyl-CoA reductase/2-hydroxyglutaryl-CoA dehydratase subunit BcrC/BadD/HgdB
VQDRGVTELPKLGWLCSYTPVEIPLAAGYLPVRIFGGENVPRTHDPRIYHLLCPYVRAVFQRYASDQAHRPEAMAFVRCCDAMLRLHDVWKAYLGGRVHLLDLPKLSSSEAIDYFAQLLRAWATDLGQGSGQAVTEERLREAIGRMNSARALFQAMGRSLREQSDRVPYGKFHLWSRRWLAEPTAQVLEEVRSEWDGLPTMRDKEQGRPKLLITSSMLDQPGLIQMMERAGLDVVAEDECMGTRHFDGLVKEHGDPFLALAERYLLKWPCPRMKGFDRRWERLDALMGEAGVQGVIAIQLKFCDQSGFDLPMLRSHLEKKGIPFLIVENDYGEGSLGQLKVRVEAFAEMLQQDWA